MKVKPAKEKGRKRQAGRHAGGEGGKRGVVKGRGSWQCPVPGGPNAGGANRPPLDAVMLRVLSNV